MHSQNNIYKNKYLKCKTKYLELQHQLNNISGGGLATAKNSFFEKIFANKDNIYTLFKNDSYLMEKLTENQIELPIITKLTVDELKENLILNKIFSIIIEGVDEKTLDEYVKIYLNKKLGFPNSIENKGRYMERMEDLIKLRKYKDTYVLEIPATFNSLMEFESFINLNKDNLDSINKKIRTKEAASIIQKQIKEAGEDDVEIILDTQKVIIVKPTTEAGSKYYGRNTQWCTAGNKDCRFNDYNKKGPLYIIQSKIISDAKFQIHFIENELMNAKDEWVDINKVKKIIDDIEFNNWFDDELGESINPVDGKLTIDSWIPNFKEKHNSLIKELTINARHSLGNSLDNLTNLKQLTFGYDFNQPLENSLNNLNNLTELTFNVRFNQPFNSSLNNLTKLQKLTLKSTYTHLLGSSLNNLINLVELSLASFNQPINNSFDNLTKLQKLTFGDIDQPLGNSLNNLTNLQELTFNHNIKPLENSLDKLINLQKLTICANISLGNSLDKLVNLENLILGEDVYDWSFSTADPDYNKPLGNSLSNLTKLKELTFGVSFDQLLGNSLNNLVNLEKLTFGFGFNKPVGKSLNNLVKLEKLTFRERFNEPLDNVLDLPNLKTVIISNWYKLPIPQKEKIEIIKEKNKM